jgi:hypothetical protein
MSNKYEQALMIKLDIKNRTFVIDETKNKMAKN